MKNILFVGFHDYDSNQMSNLSINWIHQNENTC